MKISKLGKVNKKLLSWLFAIGFTFLPISKGKTESSIQLQSDKKIVSIFNEENSASNQYGANQRVFDKDKILDDPYVLEIMQKYKPYSDFSSKEEALQYYKGYFNEIYNQGCADATICNIIFHSLEGQKEIFEKCFGFPMYKINEKGNVDFNYEALMVDIFSDRISKMPNGWEMVDKILKKNMYDYELNAYTMSEEFTRKKPDNLSESELAEWKKFDKKRSETFSYLYKRWQDAPEVDADLGLYSVNHENEIIYYISSYLTEHYMDSNISFPDENNIQPSDMVASKNFYFYVDEDGNHDEITNGIIGSHWFYITDVDKDGKIFASSWGNKYIFEPSKSSSNSYIFIIRIQIRPNYKVNYL